MKKDKDKNKDPFACRLGTVGGQAVLEGVMMKGKSRYAVASRLEDGSIKVVAEDSVSIRKKHKILNIPILRGVVNMVESLMLSYKTLAISADNLGIDEGAPESKFEKWLDEKFGSSILNVVMTVATILGLALGIFLFVFLPSLTTKAVDEATGQNLGWFKNLIEGLMKIGIFIAYLALVSLMKDIRRTFEYHGAEHKSIFCYESGKELTPENAEKCKRFHPRCGTSFMLVILIISILIFSLPFVPWDNVWLRLAVKLPLIPIIIGLGYELLMICGRHDNIITKILSAPGLWLQRITTREPDREQLEVAIAALKAALPDVFPEEAAAAEPVNLKKDKKPADSETKSGNADLIAEEKNAKETEASDIQTENMTDGNGAGEKTE